MGCFLMLRATTLVVRAIHGCRNLVGKSSRVQGNTTLKDQIYSFHRLPRLFLQPLKQDGDTCLGKKYLTECHFI